MTNFTCQFCGWTPNLPEKLSDWAKVIDGPPEFYPVCKSGKLSQKPLGYMCARCLNSANDSKANLKAILSNIRVAAHAIDRYVERQKGERLAREAARLTIIKMFQQADIIEFREEFTQKRLINNGKVPAEYRYHAGWIFVATQSSPQTIMTVERNWHRKLGVDFWYVS
ncbi:MAG TPA: hypothetical protein VM165_21835 [Planctomycetaceae bacterium]|nr:hypothetical protein [Planctomycetaceae bacterium]